MVLEGMFWIWVVCAIVAGLLWLVDKFIRKHTTPQFMSASRGKLTAWCAYVDYRLSENDPRNPAEWKITRAYKLVVVPQTVVTSIDELGTVERPIHATELSEVRGVYNSPIHGHVYPTELFVPFVNEKYFSFAQQAEIMAWTEPSIGAERAWKLLESRLPQDRWSRFTRWYWMKVADFVSSLSSKAGAIAIVVGILWIVFGGLMWSSDMQLSALVTRTRVDSQGSLKVLQTKAKDLKPWEFWDSENKVYSSYVWKIQDLGGGMRSVVLYSGETEGYAILAGSSDDISEGQKIFYRRASVPVGYGHLNTPYLISEADAQKFISAGWKLYEYPKPLEK